jgi:hypothetical protein
MTTLWVTLKLKIPSLLRNTSVAMGGGGGFSNGHLVTSFLQWLLRDVTESHVATVTLSSNGLE